MQALLSATKIKKELIEMNCNKKNETLEHALNRIEEIASSVEGWQPERDRVLFEILLVIEDARRGKIMNQSTD